jgi:UDP-N-acetylglucosamine 2-epimerase (non-hydrolysing)
MMRILHIVGARPNFMKIVSLMHEVAKHPDTFEQILVHTGQHYDDNMSKAFFNDLDIPEPDIYLGVGSGSQAEQTARIMLAFEPVILDQHPDLVLVVGDVNSTLACTLVAAKLEIRTAHVEAGLRSFDRTMPEEINRLLTDQICDLLFVSEPSGLDNLKREGCPDSKIHFVGNVMIDTLLHFLEKAERSPILNALSLEEKEYVLLTLHRPSNVDNLQVFKKILDGLKQIDRQYPIVFPVHPRTRQRIKEFQLDKYFKPLDRKNPLPDLHRIKLIDPLGYLDFCRLMSKAKLVLTDSGGIQEETTILGIPCLTLRENTERPVTVTEGTNTIVGTDPQKIIGQSRHILHKGGKKGKVPKFWDGHAARRIVEVLLKESAMLKKYYNSF